MTPSSLAFISFIVFAVGFIAVVWNMVVAFRTIALNDLMGWRLALHMSAGLLAGAGGLGLIASLIWYIVPQIVAK